MTVEENDEDVNIYYFLQQFNDEEFNCMEEDELGSYAFNDLLYTFYNLSNILVVTIKNIEKLRSLYNVVITKVLRKNNKAAITNHICEAK